MSAVKLKACAGCNILAAEHPMVAVVAKRDALVPALVTSRDGRFAAVPVCGACWTDPAHRRRPIKGHFFERAQADDAVAFAGARDSAGNPVRS
jgi:hypothetical protein